MAARKPGTPKRLCGAAVTRCTECHNTVAKARTRRGLACPKHPDAPTQPGSCERAVGPGKLRCKTHSGRAPQVIAAANTRAERAQLRAEAAISLTSLGLAIETTPVDSLQAMLDESAANVWGLRRLVQALGLDRLYADTYHQNGSPTGEAKPHVLWVMYCEERDRHTKLAEACAKLGLDERKVRIAETEVGRLFDHVVGAIADAGLTAAQTQAFKQALAARLRKGP